MAASLQKFSDNRKIDPNHQRPIQCPYCPQQYLLIWDDAEWNSVKDWIRLAEAAVRMSHRKHGDIELPSTREVAAVRLGIRPSGDVSRARWDRPAALCGRSAA
jgi:hypothetical protein